MAGREEVLLTISLKLFTNLNLLFFSFDKMIWRVFRPISHNFKLPSTKRALLLSHFCPDSLTGQSTEKRESSSLILLIYHRINFLRLRSLICVRGFFFSSPLRENNETPVYVSQKISPFVGYITRITD